MLDLRRSRFLLQGGGLQQNSKKYGRAFALPYFFDIGWEADRSRKSFPYHMPAVFAVSVRHAAAPVFPQGEQALDRLNGLLRREDRA